MKFEIRINGRLFGFELSDAAATTAIVSVAVVVLSVIAFAHPDGLGDCCIATCDHDCDSEEEP